MESEVTYTINNVDWLLTGVKYVLGCLGIVAYAVWKAQKHLNNFNLTLWFKGNKKTAIWALVMVTVVLSIITLSPETAGALKSLTGLDVSTEPASFLMLGWSLSALAYSQLKDKEV